MLVLEWLSKLKDYFFLIADPHQKNIVYPSKGKEKTNEQNKEGFLVLDRYGKCLEIDVTAANILDVSIKKAINKNFWEFCPACFAKEYATVFKQAVSLHEKVCFESYITHLQQWYKVIVCPVKQGITVFYTNITPDTQTKHALQDAENKLRAVLATTTDAHFLLAPDYKVISFNKSAAVMVLDNCGTALEAGKSILQYILPEEVEDFTAIFQQVLGGEQIQLQRRYFHTKEAGVWVDVTYTPIYNHQEELMGVSCNVININDKKRIEEKVKSQNKILREIAWQQSHEVRKPVVNILGLVEHIKETHADVASEYLDYLYQSAHELDLITTKLVLEIHEVSPEEES